MSSHRSEIKRRFEDDVRSLIQDYYLQYSDFDEGITKETFINILLDNFVSSVTHRHASKTTSYPSRRDLYNYKRDHCELFHAAFMEMGDFLNFVRP